MAQALIVGIAGQDGSYLAEFLLDKGYEVHGLIRPGATDRLWRIEGIREQVQLHEGDLSQEGGVTGVLEAIAPDEVYNLGAISSVGSSWGRPVEVAEVTALGSIRVLEALRHLDLDARYYQASTSEMFGMVKTSPQNEQTPFHPRSPYAVAKVYAHHAAINYRESFDVYACSGILFNHESPRRGEEFVTRKITRAAAAIKLGLQDELTLGNIDARRDWGFAGDYVEAMWLMLNQDQPRDYVVGTGKARSVRDFADAAFAHLDLDAAEYIRIDPALRRPADVEEVVADPSKAKVELGWEASTGFAELVGMMVEADLDALRAT